MTGALDIVGLLAEPSHCFLAVLLVVLVTVSLDTIAGCSLEVALVIIWKQDLDTVPGLFIGGGSSGCPGVRWFFGLIGWFLGGCFVLAAAHSSFSWQCVTNNLFSWQRITTWLNVLQRMRYCYYFACLVIIHTPWGDWFCYFLWHVVCPSKCNINYV